MLVGFQPVNNSTEISFSMSTHQLFVCTNVLLGQGPKYLNKYLSDILQTFQALLGSRFITCLHVFMPEVKMSLCSYT